MIGDYEMDDADDLDGEMDVEEADALGLDPNDPDFTDLAPHGMEGYSEDEEDDMESMDDDIEFEADAGDDDDVDDDLDDDF